ncbi:MAG: mobile mystery protein A [Chitinophagaceae bacterium]|nr:mobile mystery protein A [Chitinophagaceae bacterium]MCW5925549.1 mobile mystery protein A [Chitinophagaceae bacterium]
MKLKNSKLIIRQLDKRMQTLQPLRDVEHPKEGWIALIRKTLNMSLRQLGQRLSVTPQGMKKIESNESKGGITLNALREAGDALNMRLVYGFIPKEESLEKMIEIRAKELAQKIVMRTSTTMKLEGQENSDQRIREAIADMTEELRREMPKSLWD